MWSQNGDSGYKVVKSLKLFLTLFPVHLTVFWPSFTDFLFFLLPPPSSSIIGGLQLPRCVGLPQQQCLHKDLPSNVLMIIDVLNQVFNNATD